jgi:hypothetical protein
MGKENSRTFILYCDTDSAAIAASKMAVLLLALAEEGVFRTDAKICKTLPKKLSFATIDEHGVRFVFLCAKACRRQRGPA